MTIFRISHQLYLGQKHYTVYNTDRQPCSKAVSQVMPGQWQAARQDEARRPSQAMSQATALLGDICSKEVQSAWK